MKVPCFLSLSCLASVLAFPAATRAEETSLLHQFFDARTTGGTQPFWTAAQDERGVMYFGCETLITFDGERWERHPLDPAYEVRSIAIGPRGRVWIAAMDELGYCDRLPTGEIGPYHSLRAHLPDPSVHLGEVWHVFARDEGAVFVTKSLVLIWDGEKFSSDELPGGRRLAAMQIDGEIYVTHRYRGVWRLAENRLIPFLSPAELGATDMGMDGLVHVGNEWLLVTTKGLIRIRGKQAEFIPSAASDFVRNHVPTSACRLQDGRICVGTFGGVAFVSPGGELLKVVDEFEPLGAINALFVFTAQDGAIWITTSSGVLRLTTAEGVRLFGSPQGLKSKFCTSMAEVGSTLYVGSQAGIFAGDEAGKPLHFQKLAAGQSLPFYDLVEANGKLYGASYRGIYAYENSAFTLTTTFRQDPVIVRRSLDGDTVLASDGSDLVRVNPATSSPPSRVASLPESPLSITEEPGGRIWIGTRAHGVLQVDADGKVTRLESAGVRGGRSLTSRLRDHVVVCTSAGVALFRTGTNHSETVAGTPQTEPLAVSEADAGNRVWIVFASPFSSEPKMPIFGQLTVDEQGEGRWQEFAAEGLERVGHINAILAAADGFVWIAGTDQTLRLQPDLLRPVTAPPAPIVTSSIPPDAKIPFDGNAASFELAAAEYARRSALRFQTKIHGISSEWSEPTNDARIQLSGVRDGSYEFAARIINDAGLVGPETTWHFRILPPWYRTKVAYGFWTLLAGAAVLGLVQWRSHYLRAQNVRLEALVRKKTGQLEQANQAKTDFISDMSHEIRNPISGIVGLSLAMEETTLTARQKELADAIRSCATLLATLVDDVLDFSKIEAGKIDLRLAPFAVRPTLEQCAAMVAEDARRASACITIDLAEDVPPQLVGDSARIQQILLNYLTNAVKFASAGVITMGASRTPAGRIRFFVRDQGPGMSEADAAQLFTKFARLARTKNVRGSGLGLAVCRLLAEKMGGAVGVTSQPGEGSCFWAELPLTSAGNPPASSLAAAAGGPPLRALIVEDIDYNATAMQAVLRKLGVQSDVVADGPSALARLQQTFYDVAFMDWNLPGMIGTEVVSRFRAVESPLRRTIIIATTAYSADFNREACLQAGMDAFIAKPFTPEKIAAALRDLRGSLRSAASVEISAPPSVEPKPALEFDLQTLRFLGDDTAAGLREQIARYLESFETDRRAADEIVKQGDGQAIHRIAHRLESHACMVCYEPLRRIAATLQARAGTDERSEIARLLVEFNREFELFRKKLDSIRSSPEVG